MIFLSALVLATLPFVVLRCINLAKSPKIMPTICWQQMEKINFLVQNYTLGLEPKKNSPSAGHH